MLVGNRAWSIRLWAAGCAITILGCNSATEPPRRRPLSHITYVLDRSASLQEKPGVGCASVRAVVVAALTEGDPFHKGQVLEGVGFEERQKDPVSIQLWGTADSKQPGSPWILGERTLKPEQGMEDLSARRARIAKAANTIGEALVGFCDNASRMKQDHSPIYSVLSEAVSTLRNNCPDTKECLLVVQSDLVENQEPGIKKAIDAIKSGRASAAPAKLPDPIDLGGAVTVFLCGYGTSTEVVSEPKRMEVVRLWKEKILVNSRRWVEQAQCPVAHEASAGGE